MAQIQLLNKPIGPYGYGLMGLTWRAQPPPTEQAFEAMRTALAQGANFWNGGEFYGPVERNSLVLLKEYFTQYPEDAAKVVLSIKGGVNMAKFVPDGSAAGVRRSVEDSLAQLGGTKSIDLFECARVDPETPIEETMRTLAQLQSEGKIGGISLSEVSAATIHRAAAVARVAACEVELSLWATDILRNGVAAACAAHGIPVVAYSPLGRGALTGAAPRANADIPATDFRKTLPKFQDDVLQVNNLITDECAKLADKKGCTLPQIALAWVRGYTGRTIRDPTQGGKEVVLGEVIPIPGATTKDRVVENTRPDIVLSEDEMKEFDELIAKYPSQGGRYDEKQSKFLEG